MLLKNVVIFAAYFFAAKLGFMIDWRDSGASPIWIPSGIAMYAVAAWGYRLWPAVYFAAFLVNFLLILGRGFPMETSLITPAFSAIGNALQPVLGFWILTRFNQKPMKLGDIAPDSRTAINRIINYALVAFFVSGLSAVIGTTSYCVMGVNGWSTFYHMLFNWQLGDFTGIILIAPASCLLIMTIKKTV